MVSIFQIKVKDTIKYCKYTTKITLTFLCGENGRVRRASPFNLPYYGKFYHKERKVRKATGIFCESFPCSHHSTEQNDDLHWQLPQ
jgi:hypothetical protein